MLCFSWPTRATQPRQHHVTTGIASIPPPASTDSETPRSRRRAPRECVMSDLFPSLGRSHIEFVCVCFYFKFFQKKTESRWIKWEVGSREPPPRVFPFLTLCVSAPACARLVPCSRRTARAHTRSPMRAAPRGRRGRSLDRERLVGSVFARGTLRRATLRRELGCDSFPLSKEAIISNNTIFKYLHSDSGPGPLRPQASCIIRAKPRTTRFLYSACATMDVGRPRVCLAWYLRLFNNGGIVREATY